MNYKIEGKDLPLRIFDISVHKSDLTDLFIKKKSALWLILEKKEYARLRKIQAINDFKDSTPIGNIIAHLKNEANDLYRLFLNKHGDLEYCEFSIKGAPEKSGIYFIIVENKFKYIGRCGKTNFSKRFKDYGKISPTNVYKHGQSTNCHINSLINSCVQKNQTVQIGFYQLDDIKGVESLEKKILSSGSFEWNIQKS